MRHITRTIGVLIAVLALAVAGGLAVSAQSGGGYDLTWNTADNGGATFSSGGEYQLGGTAGQPDANASAGPNYSLAGGFWVRPDYRAYVPIVSRP